MEEVSVKIRRPKCQYPEAQITSRILQLPSSKQPTKNHKLTNKSNDNNGKVMMMRRRRKMNKLEELFDQEREFKRGACEEVRRERVNVDDDDDVEEEKWKFQAEMLRAECNLLRIEREIAVKKMERRRIQVERILESAVHSLVSGRNKICEGENVIMILEEEIRNLKEKLEKLQRRSGVKCLEFKSYCDSKKQACLLQRRLVKVGGASDETCFKEIKETAEASLSIKSSCRVEDQSFVSNENFHMEILRKKMEGLSKGMLLERMKEDYGSLLSTANSSAASTASTSKRIEVPDESSAKKRHPYKETMCHEDKLCSGQCKAIVRRIIDQVRVETEQWSQMQEMVEQVRDEMEELQASRDFWEERALDSDYQIQSLQSSVQEWREKALSSENKANELRAQVTLLRKEIEWLKQELSTTEASRAKASPTLAADAENETAKRVLVCRLKEDRRTNDCSTKQREALRDGRRKASACSRGFVAQKRSPLRDIENLSLLVKPDHQSSYSSFAFQF